MMREETSRRDRLTESLITCGSGAAVPDLVGGTSAIVYWVKGGENNRIERKENLDGGRIARDK